jgi:tetratricopeptide (TPR) repeat protein
LNENGSDPAGDRLQRYLQQQNRADSRTSLFIILDFILQDLSELHKQLLMLLSLHQRFVDSRLLEMMMKTAGVSQQLRAIEHFLTHLDNAGLLHHKSQGIYAIHPALSDFLGSQVMLDNSGNPGWQRAFVDVIGHLAGHHIAKPSAEQRMVFYQHAANFHSALVRAAALGMKTHVIMLTKALALYTQQQRDFTAAIRYFMQLAEWGKQTADFNSTAYAFYQMGRMAQEKSDIPAALQWYKKVLSLTETPLDEAVIADTYHQLGRITEQQQDFTIAAQWYRKSIVTKEKENNQLTIAPAYTPLAPIKPSLRNFTRVKPGLKKSANPQGTGDNKYGYALIYHQLGKIAEEKCDFVTAQWWYQKSLAMEQQQSRKLNAAITYYQLGQNAEVKQDLTAAAYWYKQSLALAEKQGNDYFAVTVYQLLERITQEQN